MVISLHNTCLLRINSMLVSSWERKRTTHERAPSRVCKALANHISRGICRPFLWILHEVDSSHALWSANPLQTLGGALLRYARIDDVSDHIMHSSSITRVWNSCFSFLSLFDFRTPGGACTRRSHSNARQPQICLEPNSVWPTGWNHQQIWIPAEEKEEKWVMERYKIRRHWVYKNW